MNTLLKNAKIFGHDSSNLLYVKESKIEYIGNDYGMAPAPDVTVDCAGKILIPGFYNTHTHLPMTLFRGMADDMPLDRWLFDVIFPAEDKLDGGAVYHASLLSIAEMLRCGVVSFSDMYFFSEEIVRAV